MTHTYHGVAHATHNIYAASVAVSHVAPAMYYAYTNNDGRETDIKMCNDIRAAFDCPKVGDI